MSNELLDSKQKTTSKNKPKIFQKLKKPFLLSVGVFEWRKNFIQILKASSLLDKESKKSIDIVLVSGTRNENTIMLEEKYQSIAKKAGIKLHCFYSIDNADLRYLYANACLFYFPSISEGFGFLPVLEAINLGSLALCSNTSATPEIVDNNKLYAFDPLDPKDLCERIHYFLKLENNELLNHKKIKKDFVKNLHLRIL